MARPKDSDRKDVRSLVLDTAKRLFLEFGYLNVTMRRIAKEIGYTPATIYLYFKNKAEILFEIHNEGFRRLSQRRARLLKKATSPLDKLRLGGRNYVAFALENPELYELMFFMREPRDYLKNESQLKKAGESGVVDYSLKSYENLRQTIIECQKDGYYPDTDPDTAAFFHWALVHGLASLTLRTGVPFARVPTAKLAEEAVDLLTSLIESTRRVGSVGGDFGQDGD